MKQVLSAVDHRPDIEAVERIPVASTILDVVCRMTGMGFAAITRVTDDRWIACSVQDGIRFGLQPGGELKVETTLCHQVHRGRESIIINDVAEDKIYCGHPTPRMYGFQSYISVPIVMPDGSFFGTLCAIDPKPRMLATPEITGSFKLFAELIAFHLDADQRVIQSEATLLREREAGELREQFIAMLGHDLRNPLAAIRAGAALMLRYPERAAEFEIHIQKSIGRMATLIESVMDFARGRLGDGMALKYDASIPIDATLMLVIQEARTSHPSRVINAVLALNEPVICDHARVGQLLSNLLGNAITYGRPTEAVQVHAWSDNGVFKLSVTNGGNPIPPEEMDNLFQPFVRGTIVDSENRGGLGLGLYISSEIARAHGGTLGVTSTHAETRFTFRMPNKPSDTA